MRDRLSERFAYLGPLRLLLFGMAMTLASSLPPATIRCVMYLTGQHHVIPHSSLTTDIMHVILAFVPSSIFNVDKTPTSFLFTSIETVRSLFSPNTHIMIALGGWGDSQGFEEAARTHHSRRRWARQVRAMMDQTGADGIDVDWEFPGGNRDDYKIVPNHQRAWEIEAFVLLLQELRVAIGRAKTLSLAVPGAGRDLIAYTSSTLPRIMELVDFVNVMTYDMMNRRDVHVAHHSGVAASQEALERYIKRGANPAKLNLGLGYFVKWFMTQNCDQDQPLGCPTQMLEDPETGADTGKTGAFSWHDETPRDLAASFSRAQARGGYFDDGSFGYWDGEEQRWWSYDTPQVIGRKLAEIVGGGKSGGVFAWGLGEDAPAYAHLAATVEGVKMLKYNRTAARDEL